MSKIDESNDFSSVVLLLTNKSDKVISKKYKLLNRVGNQHKTYVLFHSENTDEIIPEKKREKVFSFTNDILKNMGYTAIGKELLPGNNHFPLLKFYQENPYYDFYWLIEDDVHYNGNWSDFFYFFLKFSSTDFISSHIHDFHETPNWFWWNTLAHSSKEILLKNKVRSFNPIYRLSNRALAYLHNQLIDGWKGHHEVLIPTLLKQGGFKIQDFGGTGQYVAADCINRFYRMIEINQLEKLVSSSMRFKPNVNHSEITERLLYHPVKQFEG